MKIGLIADIHGNLPALHAVLDSAEGVDRWVCAGDVTGYYPNVNEVCELLQQINALVIRGNHDAYVSKQLPPAPDKKKRTGPNGSNIISQLKTYIGSSLFP